MYTNASFTHFRQKQVKYMRTSKVNSKCTLVCRHLVLRWKTSSNKICRSQREQVRTSSTILFQISNFDSKLHLKRRYILFKKKNFWILVCRLHPKMILPINFLIDNSKYGADDTVINKSKEIYYQPNLGEMAWPLNLM